MTAQPPAGMAPLAIKALESEAAYVRAMLPGLAAAQEYLAALGRHGAAERAGRVHGALLTELKRVEDAAAALVPPSTEEPAELGS